MTQAIVNKTCTFDAIDPAQMRLLATIGFQTIEEQKIVVEINAKDQTYVDTGSLWVFFKVTGSLLDNRIVCSQLWEVIQLKWHYKILT